MEAKELRIGNYYSDIDNELTSMSGYELYQMTIKENTNNLGVTEFQPIPLTEEWLLKFGFDKKEECFQDPLLDTLMFQKDNIVDVEFSDKHKLLYWHDNYSSVYHSDIKHVHQLQNLYFALTNKELTI